VVWRIEYGFKIMPFGATRNIAGASKFTFPVISAIDGYIVNDLSSNLNLTVDADTVGSTVDVLFYDGATLITTNTAQTVSGSTVTTSTPSSVRTKTVGTTITVKIKAAAVDGGLTSFTGQTATVYSPPTGGTITTTGNYRVHKFTSSGTFGNTLPNIPIEYVVCAGGGGGGRDRQQVGGNNSASGGGGGYRSSVPGEYSGRLSSAESAVATPAQDHSIIVGAGAGGNNTNNDNPTAKGGSSTFYTITSTGGGVGGVAGFDYSAGNGANGGCGGGGGSQSSPGTSGTPGTGIAGQGFDGSGPRGGGASGTGTNSYITTYITGSATSLGSGGYWGSDGGSSPYSGGINIHTAANTGGGGAKAHSNGGNGGNGGSGMVILRYALL